MRLPLLLILPVLFINLLVDWYIYRAVKRRCKRHGKFWAAFTLISSILLALALILMIVWPKGTGSDSTLTSLMWGLYTYFSIYIPKYFFVILDCVGRIPRLFGRSELPGTRWAPVIIAVIAFGLMWWGALINRFRIQVNEVEFADSRLPSAFDGLRVVQISDIHSGTYGTDTTFLAKLTETINAQHPDVVLFTGDIVNRRSDELKPFVDVLAKIHAPYGVYSVLGNHDYGDYYAYPSVEAKEADRALLRSLQARMGWKMLNNTTDYIFKDNDSIAIIGVENIGDPPFHVYGDLDEAYPGDLADPVYKILMSHNPAHWCADIAESPDKNIPLTLSGHTHAMQMELFGLSPAAFRYKTWGGMYADSDSTHSLYVNIGTGEVGIPARIGATPEITVFTLRKK